jgi:hypothetical protein
MKDLGIDEDFAALTGSKPGDNFELNKEGTEREREISQ